MTGMGHNRSASTSNSPISRSRKNHPIKVFPHRFKAEILEAKNLTDEDSILMPANITVVHPAGQESLRVDRLEQSATDPAKSRSDRFKKIDVKNQGETPRSESRIRPKDT